MNKGNDDPIRKPRKITREREGKKGDAKVTTTTSKGHRIDMKIKCGAMNTWSPRGDVRKVEVIKGEWNVQAGKGSSGFVGIIWPRWGGRQF